MKKFNYLPIQIKNKSYVQNHPKGLLTAALSNMGERFGYYIMNAVLVLFLCSKFGLSEAASGTIYSFFMLASIF